MEISITYTNLFHRISCKWLKIFAVVANLCALLIGWNYYDVMWWVQWYRIVETDGLIGLLNIYKICVPPDCKVPYPPLTVLIFISVYAFSTLFSPLIRMVFLKMFIVVIPSLITYTIIKRLRGSLEALLWVTSWPLLQVLFALQFDVLIALFILLSTIAIVRNKPGYAAMFLGLATMIKHVIGILLLFHIIFLKIVKGWKEVVKYLTIYALILGVTSLPFFISTPREFLNHILLFHSSRAPQDVSLWAITTIFLENQIEEVKQVVGSLWSLFFLFIYMLVLYMFWTQLKQTKGVNNPYLLPLYSSLILTLFISLNKVGNLNYVVWFVPTVFTFFNIKHIKIVYKLTFILGLVGGLIYAFTLLALPASVERSVFIAEDLAHWSAKALIAQSLNPYIFSLISSLFTTYETYISEPISTPTDFVTSIQLFKTLYLFRSQIMLLTIIVSQALLLFLTTLKMLWIKEYIT